MLLAILETLLRLVALELSTLVELRLLELRLLELELLAILLEPESVVALLASDLSADELCTDEGGGLAGSVLSSVPLPPQPVSAKSRKKI